MIAKRRNRRPDSASRHDAEGFTIVELLVALVILVVGVLGLARVTMTILQVRRAEQERKLAWNALVQELRTVESTPFSSIAADHDGRGFSVRMPGQVGEALRALPGDADGMPGSIRVTAPAPTADPAKLLQVTARLDWQASGAPQSMQRSIRVARSGGGTP